MRSLEQILQTLMGPGVQVGVPLDPDTGTFDGTWRSGWCTSRP